MVVNGKVKYDTLNKTAKKIIEIITITLLSAAVGYGTRIHFCGGVAAPYTDNYVAPLSIISFIVFAATFVILYLLLFLLDRYRDKINTWITITGDHSLSKKKFFIIVFAGTVLFWLPYLLSFAPASVLTDSMSSVRQILIGYYNNQVPIVYTLFVGIFLWIASLFGNINIGIFTYACFQYLVMALTCSSILTWLYTHGVKTIIVIIAGLFYAIFPAFPAYAITMWKDPLFSVGLIALSFVILKEKITWYQLLISSAVVFFFRSNGLIILAILGLIMLISKSKRISGIICLASLIVFVIISNILLNSLNAERYTEEALGIPIQQMAHSTIYDEENLSDYEKRNINRIIPLDTIKEVYTPCLVDSIKWNSQFDRACVRNNGAAILSVWSSMIPRHFDSFVKAYALETYGFWMPVVQNDYGYIDLYIAPNELGIEEKDLFKDIFGISIKEPLKNFRPSIGSGTLAWIMLLGFALCILGDEKKCWFYAPGALCWMSVMLSTPVAFSMRYVFILLLALPVYILLPFIELNKKEIKKKELK